MTFIRTICAVALSLISACAFAQPDRYPSKPIKLVVGFPPGGGADIVGRLVAKHLGDALGQPVIIDNRGGASGFIAASAVAQAAPDGYTLLLGHVNALAIAPAASAKLPYDTLKDFSAIGYIGYAPNVLVVNPNVTSAKSVKELIDLVKSKPGELAYASPGVGSANHIAGVMFTSATKTSMVHVPYRGSAPAITDLLGGQVTMNFDAMTSVVNYVKEGKMRALAVTTKERNPQLPDVPTMQEQGIKDFDVTIWYSLMGPAGLPKATVALLNDKLNGVLRKPDVKKQLAELGVTVQPLSPDQVSSLLRADIAKYSSVVKQNNIRMD
jgi:tripartite-type tricarboxylate transporter receptor subunit TctC